MHSSPATETLALDCNQNSHNAAQQLQLCTVTPAARTCDDRHSTATCLAAQSTCGFACPQVHGQLLQARALLAAQPAAVAADGDVLLAAAAPAVRWEPSFDIVHRCLDGLSKPPTLSGLLPPLR